MPRTGTSGRAFSVSLGLAALTALAALALTGCAPSASQTGNSNGLGKSSTSPSPAPAPGSTPGSTATPGDNADPNVDPNVLFTIKSTIKAYNGAIADLVEVVYRPVEVQPTFAGTAGAERELCGRYWNESIPGQRTWLKTVITSTVRGNTPWPKSSRSSEYVSMNGDPLFGGDFTGFQSHCASVVLTMPGEIVGFTPLPAGADADGAKGWGSIQYGFASTKETANDDGTFTARPTDAVTTACTIDVSPAAAAESTLAGSWSSRVQKPADLSCRFGR